MNVKLKICGMRETDNIRSVAALHPDYMGFIFFKGSARYVGEKFVIPADLPSDVKKVGVFVNEDTKVIADIAGALELDFVQLHGDETPEQCQVLKAKKLGVIKAFPVGADFDFVTTTPFKTAVDFFLFDAKGRNFGGNGIPFDWALLRKYDQQIPFFLSGGLSPENAAGIKAVTEMNVHALDVNSGVEQKPGIKDILKIEKFKKEIASL